MHDAVPLSQVATIASGKRPQRVQKEPSGDCRVPVIGGGGVSGFTNESLYGPGVLVTGRVGTLGKLFALPTPSWPSDNALVLWPKSPATDPIFLKYALQHRIADAAGMNRGAANPLLTQKDLGTLLVSHPSADTQRAIGSTLGALDDKIELNRRMNETLEAMAQAIFRDWFVDFGPVRRKLAGATDPVEIMGGLARDAAQATKLSALFPSDVDAEGTPERWRAGNLGALAEAAGEGVAPSTIRPETPYIGLEHMPRRSIALDTWETAAKVSSQKARFQRGQILFGKLRPYFHKVGIAPTDGVCSTDIVVLDSRKNFDRALVASCVSSDAFVAFTDQASTGTKMPRTSWGQMKSYGLAIADEPVRKAFSAIVGPMHDKIIASIAESRTLAETRDYLLPRLMSGELRVGDVAQEIAA